MPVRRLINMGGITQAPRGKETARFPRSIRQDCSPAAWEECRPTERELQYLHRIHLRIHLLSTM